MSAVATMSFSERVVDLLTRRGRDADPGRRSFLQRATIVATALTVNPFDFVFKPVTAYASVCGSANECTDGWTAFCCTINDGKNTCPPGSYAAGWWKVSDSAFCRGSARYYIDCNRHPTEGTCRCSCANGECDRRRTCCNNFRYGQCNQHIKGVTPVVCRVITCMPPWRWDRTCTKTKLYSPSTRSHSASCLPGKWPSHIEIKYQDMGLRGSVLGDPTTREKAAADGGRFRKYQYGFIFYRSDVGAREVRRSIAGRYRELGRESSALGYPTTDRRHVGDGQGRYNRFENGQIHARKASGTWETFGPIDRAYRRLKGPKGGLGYPVAAQTQLQDGTGETSIFQRGRLVRGPQTGVRAIIGPTWRAYEALGGPDGNHGLGYPTRSTHGTSEGGHRTDFQDGAIIWRKGLGARALWGPIFRRYEKLGAEGGALGYPVRSLLAEADGTSVLFERGGLYRTADFGTRTVRAAIHARYLALGGHTGFLGYPKWNDRKLPDGRGRRCWFVGGWIWWTSDTGAHAVHGPIADHYLGDEGGPAGRLGYPTSDVEVQPDGHRCLFEHGEIAYDTASGRFTVTMS